MTILDQIILFTTNPQISDEPLKYPVPLNADSILPNLKIDPQSPNPNPNSFSLLNPLTGFEISQSDSTLFDLNSKFFKKLKRKLKNPQSVTPSSFREWLNPFLEKIEEKKFRSFGDMEMGNGDDSDYTSVLIAKFGSFVGRDVIGLVVEGCVMTEDWKVLETLIVNKLVDHGYYSDLLFNLIAKRRSELICLCVKHFRDMKSSDLSRVLRYFLSPSKEGLVSMGEVRREWESEALAAIEKASDKKLSGKKSGLAKEAALLLMMAYDGFSSWELCLHYLVSSSVVDDVVFSSAISKLNSDEMLRLIRYLGKWLRKYERFTEAGPCPKAATSLGLNMCRWVPRIEDVVKCLGLVVDEHFASLAMHSEFHEELTAIVEVAGSLASEGRLCSSVANLIEILNPEVRGA